MLIEFSVANYLSFQEPVTFSMRAAKLRSKNKELHQDAVFEAGHKLKLLKSAAIYGANASGKSNLIAALRFMQQMVLGSAQRQSTDPIGTQPFALNTNTENAPSYFQIVFALDDKIYRYGFELDREKVHAEWLYHTRQRETMLFLREGQEFEISGAFKEGRGLEDKIRPNALFLSVADQFNGSVSRSILTWFELKLYLISGLTDDNHKYHTVIRAADESYRASIVAFIKELDVSIVDIQKSKQIKLEFPISDKVSEEELEKLKHKFNIQFNTFHKKYTGQDEIDVATFSLEQESEGTRKMFFLAGLVFNTLILGAVLVIDEFDTHLHPLLSAKIIRLFNSCETNPRNAQLVFATHDTTLLDKDFFRRDQIWFTKKKLPRRDRFVFAGRVSGAQRCLVCQRLYCWQI